MFAAGSLMLVGFGVIALGLVAPTMYDIGIVVLLIASIGIVVRIADWWRWLRD